MSMKGLQRQVGKVLGGYEPKKDSWPALTGNGRGTVSVAGRPGWIYVRTGSDDLPGQAFNNRVPLRDDLPIIVGYDALQPTLFQVLTIREVYAGSGSGDNPVPMVVAHHGTHEFGADEGGGDVVWVQKQQVVPMLATPTSPNTMLVNVYADFYPWDDSWNWFDGAASEDLTARIPATGGKAIYVLVSIDGATNTLQYTNGDEFTILLPPPDMGDLIPAPPAGSVPVVAVYLPNGVTSLGWDNLFDVRLFNQPMGGSVMPGVHDHSTDAEGGLLSRYLSLGGPTHLDYITGLMTEYGTVQLALNACAESDSVLVPRAYTENLTWPAVDYVRLLGFPNTGSAIYGLSFGSKIIGTIDIGNNDAIIQDIHINGDITLDGASSYLSMVDCYHLGDILDGGTPGDLFLQHTVIDGDIEVDRVGLLGAWINGVRTVNIETFFRGEVKWAETTGDHAHAGVAGDGGQLDWDDVWSDAVHDHSDAANGGATLGVTHLSYGAGIKFTSAHGWFAMDTADASDTGRMSFAAGGLPSSARGAYVDFFGNEYATDGFRGVFIFEAGIVPGGSSINGSIGFYTGGAKRVEILRTGVVIMASYGAGDAQFLAGGTITSVSDESLKRDIHNAEIGLEEVLQMQGKRWRFTKESGLNDKDNTVYQGFIANDIEKIVPSAVGKDANGKRSLSYSSLMPAFTEAFREVDARLKKLEAIK